MDHLDQRSASYEQDLERDDIRGSSVAAAAQQRAYRVSNHEGFMEQALPSQYHATMRVASQIPPTSLRGIQHISQKTEQATRLLQSYSLYKREQLPEELQDEDLDPVLDGDDGLAEALETVDPDIYEIEEIKLCNLTKRVTDLATAARQSLLYSRDIPTKSMEIQAIPFNKEKSSDQIRWLRFQMVQSQESLQVVVMSARQASQESDRDPHFLFETTLDKDSYLDLQKKQSIHTSFSEFPKRMATLLDYCILQLHGSADVKSRFTCIVNEGDNDDDTQTMYICEQNEFRHLVHLQLEFKRMSESRQAEFLGEESSIQHKLMQSYLKQKIVLVQKSRDNCAAMLDINENLKLLKEENQKVIDDIHQKHLQEFEGLEAARAQELEEASEQHRNEVGELQAQSSDVIEQLKQENAALCQQLALTQSNLEKEQLKNEHASGELGSLRAQVQEQSAEISSLQEKSEGQAAVISGLEKDKLQLTLEGDNKSSEIGGLQSTSKELKDQLTKETQELQALRLDHAKLTQQSESQLENISSLEKQITQLNESVEQQKEEVMKQKEKKQQFKGNYQSSQEEIQRHLSQISDLEKKLADSEAHGQDQDVTISEKKQAIDALQAKLRETQGTLQSNNATIEELKSSLAEAQKYSFRAILNNRNSAHHPSAAPPGYSGQFQAAQVPGQQTLSQYLRSNDLRQSSNSPYRQSQPAGGDGAAQQALSSASKLQDPNASVQNANAANDGPGSQSKGFQGASSSIMNQQLSSTKQQDPEQVITQYSAAQHVKMPLTDYYMNKFGGDTQTTQADQQRRTHSRQEGELSVQNLGSENQLMLKMHRQMQQRSQAQAELVNGQNSSSFRPAQADQSQQQDHLTLGNTMGNQFAQQLERGKIHAQLQSSYGRKLNRDESEQSAMFGASSVGQSPGMTQVDSRRQIQSREMVEQNQRMYDYNQASKETFGSGRFAPETANNAERDAEAAAESRQSEHE